MYRCVLGLFFNNACKNFFLILTTDQQTNFTPESKRLIEAKTKKQNNGIYSIRKGGGDMGLV